MMKKVNILLPLSLSAFLSPPALTTDISFSDDKIVCSHPISPLFETGCNDYSQAHGHFELAAAQAADVPDFLFKAFFYYAPLMSQGYSKEKIIMGIYSETEDNAARALNDVLDKKFKAKPQHIYMSPSQGINGRISMWTYRVGRKLKLILNDVEPVSNHSELEALKKQTRALISTVEGGELVSFLEKEYPQEQSLSEKVRDFLDDIFYPDSNQSLLTAYRLRGLGKKYEGKSTEILDQSGQLKLIFPHSALKKTDGALETLVTMYYLDKGELLEGLFAFLSFPDKSFKVLNEIYAEIKKYFPKPESLAVVYKVETTAFIIALTLEEWASLGGYDLPKGRKEVVYQSVYKKLTAKPLSLKNYLDLLKDVNLQSFPSENPVSGKSLAYDVIKYFRTDIKDVASYEAGIQEVIKVVDSDLKKEQEESDRFAQELMRSSSKSKPRKGQEKTLSQLQSLNPQIRQRRRKLKKLSSRVLLQKKTLKVNKKYHLLLKPLKT